MVTWNVCGRTRIRTQILRLLGLIHKFARVPEISSLEHTSQWVVCYAFLSSTIVFAMGTPYEQKLFVTGFNMSFKEVGSYYQPRNLFLLIQTDMLFMKHTVSEIVFLPGNQQLISFNHITQLSLPFLCV